MADGLLYRYVDAEDGLPRGEATSAVCTFWLVEDLAAIGRIDEATALFERMLARATPLGPFAEELEPAAGAHPGNFPQTLTHPGLISAVGALAGGGGRQENGPGAPRRRGRLARVLPATHTDTRTKSRGRCLPDRSRRNL